MTVDSFLRKQKGLLGGLAKNLLSRPKADDGPVRIQRNDLLFQPYGGLIIRSIRIVPLDFGISIGDTSKGWSNKLTRLVNNLHKNTTQGTIRKNLFFRKGGRISPFLLGANERHLRDLAFIQDAKIQVHPVPESPDSADILILTKDVYSLGGGLNVSRIDRIEATVQEDNMGGHGDRLQVQTLYNRERKTSFGYGGEWDARNIAGSYIDGYAGYKNFNRSFITGKAEEGVGYLRFIKPLVHPYMKWTYAAEASVHKTQNMYAPDSLYDADARYGFLSADAWVAWNGSADKLNAENDAERLNWLYGLRFMKKEFTARPEHFGGKYFYRFSDFTAVLAGLSLFKQNFFKTQYIYGFGRNEDVPGGVELSLTAGWTKKSGRERPYVGIDYQRYFFTPREDYVYFTLRGGSYFYKRKFEDVAFLAGIDYFTRLKQFSKRWKQRTFINASLSRQIGYRLNDPLLLESKYGLQGFDNNEVAGNLRATFKGESVFYSPWAPLLFKLAPFVFGSTTVFGFEDGAKRQQHLYSAVGGGLRTRNESLIFGTIEVRGIYYPRPGFYNERWRVEFNTNIRFTYNQQFIKRPDFVGIN